MSTFDMYVATWSAWELEGDNIKSSYMLLVHVVNYSTMRHVEYVHNNAPDVLGL
jgi:hypothetical protein